MRLALCTYPVAWVWSVAASFLLTSTLLYFVWEGVGDVKVTVTNY